MVSLQATTPRAIKSRLHIVQSIGVAVLLLCVLYIDHKQSHAEPPDTYRSTSGFTIAVGLLSSNPFMMVLAEPLWHLSPGRLLNGWTMALVYTLSIPVSLWAMIQWTWLPLEEPDNESKQAMFFYQWKRAVSATLEAPLYRVLYLFHFGWLSYDIPQSALLGMLRDLSSAIGLAIVLICAVPWDSSEYSGAKRCVFLVASSLGITSTTLLGCKFVDTFTEILEEAGTNSLV